MFPVHGCELALLLHLMLSPYGTWNANTELVADYEVKAFHGDRVHLHCTSAANLTVSWKYYGQTSTGEGRIVSHNGIVYDSFQPRFTQKVKGTLVIYNVQLTDAGYYECLGRNGFLSLGLVRLQVIEAAVPITVQGHSSPLPFVSSPEHMVLERTPENLSTDNRAVIAVVIVLSIAVIALLLSVVILYLKINRSLCFRVKDKHCPELNQLNQVSSHL